jgi:hypothetical protein
VPDHSQDWLCHKEILAEPSDESLLPQWAKSQAQIQDESVPMNSAVAEERRKWIAKVLREILKIEPGMRRRIYSRFSQRKEAYQLEHDELTYTSNVPTSK